MGTGSYRGARSFANGFDANFPAMVYTGGKLTVEKGGIAEHGRFALREPGGDIVIDPTGKATVADLGDASGTLITDSGRASEDAGEPMEHATQELLPLSRNWRTGRGLTGRSCNEHYPSRGLESPLLSDWWWG